MIRVGVFPVIRLSTRSAVINQHHDWYPREAVRVDRYIFVCVYAAAAKRHASVISSALNGLFRHGSVAQILNGNTLRECLNGAYLASSLPCSFKNPVIRLLRPFVRPLMCSSSASRTPSRINIFVHMQFRHHMHFSSYASHFCIASASRS